MGLAVPPVNPEPDYVDPIKIIKGDVPDQVLKVKRTRLVMVDRFQMREHILVDNHFNIYFVYDAKLSSGDTYSHGMRLKPSQVEEGGGNNQVDVDPYLTDENIHKCQWDALMVFSKTEEAIKKARLAPSSNGKGNLIIPGNFERN